MTYVRPGDLGIGRLFNRVRDAIVVADVATGRIVLWNPAAEAVFGYPAEQVTGQPLEMLIPERLRAAHRAGLDRYRQSGQGEFIDRGTVLELPALHQRGHEIFIEMTLSPIDAEDDRRFVLAVIREVTERKRAEAAERELIRAQAAQAEAEERQREAQAAIAARDTFLSVAAHELRTPVTSIVGSAQLAMRQIDRSEAELDVPRLRHRLGMINRQSLRLARLVTQLLDISRLQTGRLALEIELTDLVGLVQGVVSDASAGREQYQFEVRAPAQLIVPVDPLRFEQVLINLVDNAMKYSPEGGWVMVEVAQPESDRVRISVTDRGMGIDPEHRAYIFDRFYRGSNTDRTTGLGLGLYISHQIVELHGGEIRVEHPPEGGARFVIEIPVTTNS